MEQNSAGDPTPAGRPVRSPDGWDDTARTCLSCIAGHTEQDGKRVGAIAARVKLPAKKTFDVIDAPVMVIAAHHGRSLVVTTDIEDMPAYRDALGEHQMGTCHPDRPHHIL